MRGLHESNVSLIIQKVEDILIKCGKFSLPDKRRLLEESGLTYTNVDAGGNDGETTEKKAVLQREKEAAHAQRAVNNL